MTCASGGSEHTTASASLARTLLARHLHFNIGQYFKVYAFENTADPLWLAYVARQKVGRLHLIVSQLLNSMLQPMFVMTSDGFHSNTRSNEIGNAAVLAQRHFVFKLLSSGLTISLLRDTEFRQSKVYMVILGPYFAESAHRYSLSYSRARGTAALNLYSAKSSGVQWRKRTRFWPDARLNQP